MERYAGWSDAARALAERCAARHGGWELWDRVAEVSFTCASLSGMVPALKGLGRSFQRPWRVSFVPHAFRAVFEDYPAPGARIEFDRGAVREYGESGALVSEDPEHRRRFDGARKLARWKPCDAAYFFGYAVTYYQCLPFLLERTRLVHHAAARSGVEESVLVDFPPDVVTHCTRQRVFFAADGRIVRHDYTADILGSWARAAHFWSNYDDTSGLLVARTRHVTPRVLGTPMPGVVLHAELVDVDVRFL